MGIRIKKFVNYLEEELQDKFLLKEKILLEKIEVSFNLELGDSLEDVKVIGLFNFLEVLTGQKPCVKRMLISYKAGKKVGNLRLLVTLWKKHMFIFLEYLLTGIFPIKKKRVFNYTGNFMGANTIWYLIEDFGIFQEIPSIVYNIIKDEKIEIKLFMLGGQFLEKKYWLQAIKAPNIK